MIVSGGVAGVVLFALFVTNILMGFLTIFTGMRYTGEAFE